MQNEHFDHLNNLETEFVGLLRTKYISGQEEHGGKLWLKTNLLDEAINEAIDQVVYLLTLRQQLRDGNGRQDISPKS